MLAKVKLASNFNTIISMQFLNNNIYQFNRQVNSFGFISAAPSGIISLKLIELTIK